MNRADIEKIVKEAAKRGVSPDLNLADLSGVDFGDTLVLQFGPLGSRKAQLVIKNGPRIDEAMTGCHISTLDAFEEKVKEHYPDEASIYRREYLAVIACARILIEIRREGGMNSGCKVCNPAMPNITEAEAIWVELAGVKKDCSQCNGKGECRVTAHEHYLQRPGEYPQRLVCPDCNGTCKVLVLPGLRTDYGHLGCREGSCEFADFTEIQDTIDDCKGLGWVPAPMHLETLLKAMRRAGFRPQLRNIGWYFQSPAPENNQQTLQHFEVIDGDDLLAALKAAKAAIVHYFQSNDRRNW